MLDIPGIEYFKKNTWCGSHQNKRCRIAVAEDKFDVAIWDGPFGYEATSDENKAFTQFDYTKEGLIEIKEFLDKQLL